LLPLSEARDVYRVAVDVERSRLVAEATAALRAAAPPSAAD
jgi:hypothetical protein